MAALSVNGRTHQVDVDPDTPLLWVMREQVGLTGTKYGCGIAQCGACTVHIDGVAMRSCSVPVERGRPARRSPPSRACRRTARCTRCRRPGSSTTCRSAATASAGMIMAAAALLKDKPKPTDADIDADDHQHLPLRHLPAGARGDPRRGASA